MHTYMILRLHFAAQSVHAWCGLNLIGFWFDSAFFASLFTTLDGNARANLFIFICLHFCLYYCVCVCVCVCGLVGWCQSPFSRLGFLTSLLCVFFSFGQSFAFLACLEHDASFLFRFFARVCRFSSRQTIEIITESTSQSAPIYTLVQLLDVIF